MIVIQTDHFMNNLVTKCLAEGTKSKIINIKEYQFNQTDKLASYGILRGTGDILRKAKKFIYLDHGYMAASKRSFNQGRTMINDMSGYFRIVENDFIGFEIKNFDNSRLKKLEINIKPQRKSGEYIILSEPSSAMYNFYKLGNWTQKTITELQKYTDRKIYIHNKFSNIPLDKLLSKAWAFVSFQSTAGFKAMTNGIPAHFTHNSLKKINSIKNIENGIIDYSVFLSLSYNQWTLKEIKEGLINDYYNF